MNMLFLSSHHALSFWPKRTFLWYDNPSYSPNLSHFDLFLFLKTQVQLHGHYLGTVENMQQVVMNHVKAVSVEGVGTMSLLIGGFLRELFWMR